MNIYLASNNKGKITELSKCFKNSKVFSESDIEKLLGIKIDIEENGNTFEENAIIKAKYMANLLENILKEDDIVIADDSGIIIESMPNILGVFTKRQMLKWCNENNKNEIDFYNYITSICPTPKTCIFESVIATIKNNKCTTYIGTLKGTLADKCRGENGFGFDPIFEINGKTIAEMTDEEKSIINPRIEAINKMKDYYSNN